MNPSIQSLIFLTGALVSAISTNDIDSAYSEMNGFYRNLRFSQDSAGLSMPFLSMPTAPLENDELPITGKSQSGGKSKAGSKTGKSGIGKSATTAGLEASVEVTGKSGKSESTGKSSGKSAAAPKASTEVAEALDKIAGPSGKSKAAKTGKSSTGKSAAAPKASAAALDEVPSTPVGKSGKSAKQISTAATTDRGIPLNIEEAAEGVSGKTGSKSAGESSPKKAAPVEDVVTRTSFEAAALATAAGESGVLGQVSIVLVLAAASVLSVGLLF